MSQSFFKRIIGLLVLVTVLFSCASDLDFNQANNLKLEPVVVGNMAYFDVAANEFVTGGIEQPVSIDRPIVDVFKGAFLKDNVARTDFFFEVTNTIKRGYVIDIVLLNDSNQPLYTITLPVPAYTGAPNVLTKTEIFQNAKLNLLKSTTKMAFVVTISRGTALNESSSGSLKLRSSATVYFAI
jgi:hypothetical protein